MGVAGELNTHIRPHLNYNLTMATRNRIPNTINLYFSISIDGLKEDVGTELIDYFNYYGMACAKTDFISCPALVD